MAITLESIQRSTAIKAPRIVLYGVPGIGKSTWAAAADSPIFLLTEDGLGDLEVDHFPLATSYTDVLEALRSLYESDHAFKTVVVDTLDALEPMLWAHVAARLKVQDIGDIEFQRGYEAARDEWRPLLHCFDLLRNDRGMAVILIAHSDVRRLEPPDSAPYDKYELKLHKKTAPVVREWCDALFFAHYRVSVNVEKGAFGKKSARAVGQGERVMHTQERPAWNAKNRYALPPEIPFSWAAFTEAIAGRPAQTTGGK